MLNSLRPLLEPKTGSGSLTPSCLLTSRPMRTPHAGKSFRLLFHHRTEVVATSGALLLPVLFQSLVGVSS